MTISRTPYFGLGIVFAPKTKENNGHIIINFLVWEINFQWGHVND
jgi:hypothetical protein